MPQNLAFLDNHLSFWLQYLVDLPSHVSTFTLTRIVTRLVGLNAAHACTPISSPLAFIPGHYSDCLRIQLRSHTFLAFRRLGESTVTADPMELSLPFSRLDPRDIIRAARIS